MVDVASKRDDPPWLEEIMDQAKLEALADASLNAQKELTKAYTEWERANALWSSMEVPPSETSIMSEVRRILGQHDTTDGTGIKRYLIESARDTAAKRKAEEARNEAKEKMEARGREVHESFERLIQYFREVAS